MKTRKMTLIEILVVMVIISVLVSIGTGVVTLIQEIGKQANTDGKMSMVSQAMEKYKAEYGDYYVNVLISESGRINIAGKDGKNLDYYFNPEPNPEKYGKRIKYDKFYFPEADAGKVKFCSRVEVGRKDQDPSYQIISFLGEKYKYTETPELEGDPTGLRDGWGNLFRYNCPGKYNQSKYDLWSAGPDGLTDYENPDAEVNRDDVTNWKVKQ